MKKMVFAVKMMEWVKSGLYKNKTVTQISAR